MSLIQPLDQRFIRTFKARYTRYSVKRIVNAMEENPNRENIMKVWKDYIIEDAIIVTEKADSSCKHDVNLQYRYIVSTIRVFSFL